MEGEKIIIPNTSQVANKDRGMMRSYVKLCVKSHVHFKGFHTHVQAYTWVIILFTLYGDCTFDILASILGCYLGKKIPAKNRYLPAEKQKGS